MSRCLERLHAWLPRERVLHFVKYGLVGLCGVGVNFLMFRFFDEMTALDAEHAAQAALVCSGQFVFVGHAAVTWSGTKGRPLWLTYLTFIAGQVVAVILNSWMFETATDFGLHKLLVYAVALGVCLPFTWCYNRYVVFPTEKMPEEWLVRLFRKLVELNKGRQ